MFKRLFARSVTRDSVVRLLQPINWPRATIFMMHRFELPELGVEGHNVAALRRHLAYLRRHRYTIARLEDFVTAVINGRPIDKTTVVFTVDDGYSDFWDVGAPVFAEFDCPVTVFPVTDFVDGKLWNWWDRVEYIVRETKVARAQCMVGSDTYQLGREAHQPSDDLEPLFCMLKLVPDDVKEESIRQLAIRLEVEVPTAAPERYRSMSWDQIRRSASQGVTFGPHTISHPVLSRVDHQRARQEIAGSWAAISAATSAAVPIFCYPNGDDGDFTSRDQRIVREIGMIGALSTTSGYVTATNDHRGSFDRYAIRRFTYSDKTTTFIQIVTGVEGLKDELRSLINQPAAYYRHLKGRK